MITGKIMDILENPEEESVNPFETDDLEQYMIDHYPRFDTEPKEEILARKFCVNLV